MAEIRKNGRAEATDEYGQKSTYVIGCVANGCGELTVIAPGRAECPTCGDVVTEAGFTE